MNVQNLIAEFVMITSTVSEICFKYFSMSAISFVCFAVLWSISGTFGLFLMMSKTYLL